MISKADEVRAALLGAVNPMSGGDGLSRDTAIIVHRGGPNDAAGTEYAFIGAYFDQVAWGLTEQALGYDPSGRMIDCLKVTAAGSEFEFYFDITEAMGDLRSQSSGLLGEHAQKEEHRSEPDDLK